MGPTRNPTLALKLKLRSVCANKFKAIITLVCSNYSESNFRPRLFSLHMLASICRRELIAIRVVLIMGARGLICWQRGLSRWPVWCANLFVKLAVTGCWRVFRPRPQRGLRSPPPVIIYSVNNELWLRRAPTPRVFLSPPAVLFSFWQTRGLIFRANNGEHSSE